jgi:serine/threonine-protein kinase
MGRFMKSPGLLLSLLCFAGFAPLRADDSASQLASQSREIRQRYCGRCHGTNGTAKGDFGFITNTRQLIATKMIVPGDPDASELLTRIREGSMPPEGEKQRPTPAEVLVLEKWIKVGAPADETETPARPFRTERDILTAIREHLRDLKEDDRPFQRYFSLLNLHNSADVSARDLRLYRAAVAKVLTALSGRDRPDVFRQLDASGTVLAVDLRRLRWDKEKSWQEVLRRYPYGLVYQDSMDRELQAVAKAVAHLGDPECGLPYVRADWFVATASRPPLSGKVLSLLDPADKDDRLIALDAIGADRNGPIALLARRYQRDLKLDDMACELGLRDTKLIQERLRDPRFAPVLSGASLKRETWTSGGDRTRTLFQETASALGLGTPYSPSFD